MLCWAKERKKTQCFERSIDEVAAEKLRCEGRVGEERGVMEVEVGSGIKWVT